MNNSARNFRNYKVGQDAVEYATLVFFFRHAKRKKHLRKLNWHLLLFETRNVLRANLLNHKIHEESTSES